jgi:hypothetical protein
MARVVADPSADLGVVWNTFPRLHAALAVFVLLVATVLAVCKLRGQTSPQQTLLVNLETRGRAVLHTLFDGERASTPPC